MNPMRVQTFILFLISITAFSQKSYLEGIVLDKESGEPLEDVVVSIEGLSISVFSNASGGFALRIYLLVTTTCIFSCSEKLGESLA